MRLSSTQQAKECYLEALSLDVRCYDAFVALVGGEMMTVEEGARSSSSLDVSLGLLTVLNHNRVGHDPEPLLPRADRGVRRIHPDDVHRQAQEGAPDFSRRLTQLFD